VALILVAAAAAISLGVQDQLTVEALAHRHEMLQAYVDAHPALSAVLFVAGFATFICLCLPGLSLGAAFAGMLFGAVEGGLAAIAGATIGASVVLFASRRAVGDLSKGRLGPAITQVENGLREHGLLYLISLRLLVVMPFWLVNLASGCVRVPLRTYAAGTALGIAPALMLYALLGQRLAELLAAGGHADASFFQRPGVYIPLIGLCVLSVAPLAYVALRKRIGRRPRT
jgi:uncharacterized membrane protein YdjX (TVP38/TMEM64 family)